MKPTILFADDEPNILSGLRRTTRSKRSDWNMIFAEGGQAAQEAIEANTIDAVVTDMRMPQIDGADVLRHAAEHAPTSIRFVLSGEADLDLTSRAIHYSHQFHSKPCDDGVLLAGLATGLALRNELKSARSLHQMSLIDKLGSSEDVVDQLKDLLVDPQADTDPIAALIRQSPGLTIRILQLANSSYFGPKRTTCNVGEALNAIGLNVLKRLADQNVLQDRIDRCQTGFAEAEGSLARTIFQMTQATRFSHEAHAIACLLELCTWLDNNEGHTPFPAIYIARLLGLPHMVSDVISCLTRFDIDLPPAQGAEKILTAMELSMTRVAQ